MAVATDAAPSLSLSFSDINPLWVTVCKTVRPMLSDRCLSSPVSLPFLSVTFVHCGQTAGWIKMKLGTEVGLALATFRQMGTQLPSPKGAQPPIFGPCLLWPNGWMRHCVRWHPAPLHQKGAQQPAPLFGPCLLWPNGPMDQDATWYGGRPWPRPHCVRWVPRFPKMGAQSPNFRPTSVVAKRLDVSRCQLVRR